MAELLAPTRLAIPVNKSHNADLGYPKNSILLRFLETSIDATFLERPTVADAWVCSIKTPPKCKVVIFSYIRS
jgi:hypothetical protein